MAITPTLAPQILMDAAPWRTGQHYCYVSTLQNLFLSRYVVHSPTARETLCVIRMTTVAENVVTNRFELGYPNRGVDY